MLIPFSGLSSILDVGSIVITNGNYVYTTSNVAAIGTGDFTFEAWVKPDAGASGGIIGIEGDGADEAILRGDLPGDTLTTEIDNTATTLVGAGVSAGSWQHVAISRSSGTVSGYLGGSRKISSSLSGNINAGRVVVGSKNIGASANNFAGKIALARVSDIARYSGASITPSKSTLVDANTLALIGSFDGGATISDLAGSALTEFGAPSASDDNPF